MKIPHTVGFTIVLVTSILASLSLHAEDTFVHFYRNDNKFNTIRFAEKGFIRHQSIAEINDWLEINPMTGEDATMIKAIRVDSVVIRQTDIPTLNFTLPDYPDATQLWDKELYVAANLTIEGNGSCADASEMSLTIKGRGNTTWTFPKKPIRLKFAKKTSICGFPKMKSYVLLANFIDNTLMRNAVAMWIAQKTGAAYANTIVPVNINFNGNPLGSFMLTQKIGLNAGSIADIDETEGMLWELSTEYDEKYKFRSPINNLPVMVKDPDLDEIASNDPTGLSAQERFELWKEDFIVAEEMASTDYRFEYFDLDALTHYMLVNDVMGNSEMGHPKSVYLNKARLGTDAKYCFGPVWDFDVTGNFAYPKADLPGGVAYADPDGYLWYNDLISELVNNPEFQSAYSDLVKQFIDEVYPELLLFIDEYAQMIEPSAKNNGVIWSGSGSFGWCCFSPSFNHAEKVAAFKQWIIGRVDWMRSAYLNE